MKKIIFIILFISVFFISGCATIPQELQNIPVDKEITLLKVKTSPEKYIGKTVLWGGKIIRCENKKNFTLLEVIQIPLDFWARPITDTASEGRFLVKASKFIDCAVYSKDKFITVAGVLKGFKEGKIGEMPYKYPIIKAKGIHLWKEEEIHPPLPPYPCICDYYWYRWYPCYCPGCYPLYYPWCCPCW